MDGWPCDRSDLVFAWALFLTAKPNLLRRRIFLPSRHDLRIRYQKMISRRFSGYDDANRVSLFFDDSRHNLSVRCDPKRDRIFLESFIELKNQLLDAVRRPAPGPLPHRILQRLDGYLQFLRFVKQPQKFKLIVGKFENPSLPENGVSEEDELRESVVPASVQMELHGDVFLVRCCNMSVGRNEPKCSLIHVHNSG